MTYAGPQDMSSAGGGTGAAIVGLIELVFVVATVAGLWKVFAKAGQPGWASIIPIYNAVVMLQIAQKPIWWIILFLIPIVNVVIAILVAVEIAKRFNQGAGFGVGMAFLPFIFYPMLGFGSAAYQGSA
jgi:Family of unknown function (DUF5684)